MSTCDIEEQIYEILGISASQTLKKFICGKILPGILLETHRKVALRHIEFQGNHN